MQHKLEPDGRMIATSEKKYRPTKAGTKRTAGATKREGKLVIDALMLHDDVRKATLMQAEKKQNLSVHLTPDPGRLIAPPRQGSELIAYIFLKS